MNVVKCGQAKVPDPSLLTFLPFGSVSLVGIGQTMASSIERTLYMT